ncbi:hypothetical protein QYF36_007125 [Acer negundo]|nr:hypothetical protein QYF36_007125 [Acer negundo]
MIVLHRIDVKRLPSHGDMEEETSVLAPNSMISNLGGKRSKREANDEEHNMDRDSSVPANSGGGSGGIMLSDLRSHDSGRINKRWWSESTTSDGVKEISDGGRNRGQRVRTRVDTGSFLHEF